jgi:energy-coupling factor transporter ATP-binding protein EcfA2
MTKLFTFTSLPNARRGSNEANIFIHGYSAGHNVEDRQTLLASIPESISHHTNIFAFWPSSHFARFNRRSKTLLETSSGVSLPLTAAVAAVDRGAHFWQIRSRAEEMGESLLDQLSEHLRLHHLGIDTVNLIGHSLGGRLVISCLKKLSAGQGHRLVINDVLLMAAAATIEPQEAQSLRRVLNGRLINAYSKSDWTLLMNAGEVCLGRNQVEHFENIEITSFSHGDYWKKLPQVLTHVGFKAALQEQEFEVVEEEVDVFAPEPSPAPLQEVNPMTLELDTPDDIYQRVNDELARIALTLNTSSTDPALNLAQRNARELLKEQQIRLQAQLKALQENAEWKTFTIAVYGETGAGKSTLIETLRILLQEPTKRAHQQAFRDLHNQYGLGEADLQRLQEAIDQADVELDELSRQLQASIERQNHLHSEALNAVAGLRGLIAERKETASLWQKLIHLFKKMPEEAQLALAEQQLTHVVTARDGVIDPLRVQHSKAEQGKHALVQQQAEQRLVSERYLEKLHTLADGEIIGDGRADFTRQTQRYDMTLNDQPFALLDVPGIEGNEGLVVSQIEKAVQTAHAVLYVTNQAAPPQTGDDQRKGTLEKIKEHLGAQTEVWTIFNKKITNPKHSLTARPLISEDEAASLDGLNEKMRLQLGDHYRNVFSLSALPAFLASTEHFAPNSQNAARRNKILADFKPEELLEKTRLRAFLYLLNANLLAGSDAKISRANFHKAKNAVDHTVTALDALKARFSQLLEDLRLDGQSAQVQLKGSFTSLKKRLETAGETEIDHFVSNVRSAMYEHVDAEISNDEFKQAFRNAIDAQQRQLSDRLPVAIFKEVERFQKEAEDILIRFETQARELTGIYATLGKTNLHTEFDLKIEVDNGIKFGSLLLGVAGTIAGIFLTGGTGLLVLAPALAGLVLSTYKAVRSAFSSDYKKSQQRDAVDSNLRDAAGQLRTLLYDGLRTALTEMEKKIRVLDKALEAPIKQTAGLVQLLGQSTDQLNTLSRQIDNAGTL